MKLPTVLVNGLGKTGLAIRKASPGILLGCGFVSMTASIIFAVKSARKHDELASDHNERLQEAKTEYVIPDDYEALAIHERGQGEDGSFKAEIVKRSQKEINRDITKCYAVTLVKGLKLYSPTIICSLLAVACFKASYDIQARRITGLTVACNGLREYISQYEKRNIELNGQKSHEMCKYGYKDVERTYEDPDTGEMVTEVERVPAYEAEDWNESVKGLSFEPGTIRFSKETTPLYQEAFQDLNYMTLQSALHDLIVIFRARGWAVENDLRNILGMEFTKDGAIRGWVKGHGPDPDIGIDAPVNRMALNGFSKNPDTRELIPWILECNFHGNIYDLLTKDEEAEEINIRRLEEGL